ncbi:MAG: hypothetical protein O9270_13810, partial [Aquidulcibacter sp.]|uniref:hypothetical protein n=1 Tax=Aquidulcibacter sp. TaxID=2052990 RepID=UPI0022CA18CA
MFRTALFAFGAFAMPLAVVANPAQTTTAAQAFSNPFFEAKATKFGAPAFDRIRPEHFRPAFYEG